MAKAKRKNAGSKSTEVDTSERGLLPENLPSSRSKPYSKTVEMRTPDRVILPDTEYIDAERRAKRAANKELKKEPQHSASKNAAIETGAVSSTSPHRSRAVSDAMTSAVDLETEFFQATTPEEWGSVLRTLREDLGVPVGVLARRMEKDPRAVHRLENGEVAPKIDTIEHYLSALDPSLKLGVLRSKPVGPKNVK